MKEESLCDLLSLISPHSPASDHSSSSDFSIPSFMMSLITSLTTLLASLSGWQKLAAFRPPQKIQQNLCRKREQSLCDLLSRISPHHSPNHSSSMTSLITSLATLLASSSTCLSITWPKTISKTMSLHPRCHEYYKAVWRSSVGLFEPPVVFM